MRQILIGLMVAGVAFSQWAEAQSSPPVAVNGVIDLRHWDFGRQGTIKLDGQWGFYWKELHSPSGVAMFHPSRVFKVPSLWNNARIGSDTLGGMGYATYSLAVLLPKDRKPLSLAIDDCYTSYLLYLNHQPFSGNGVVGKTSEESIPEWKPFTKAVRVTSDTLELVMQIANFAHRKGGMSQSIEIGEEDLLNRRRELELAYSWILAGAIFMAGLFFFGLYLFGKHDKAMLFFALFSIIYSYRNIGSDLYPVSSLLDSVPWHIIVRAQHLCVFVALHFFILYLQELYPNEIYKPAFRVFSWITAGMTAVTFVGPVWLVTTLVPPYLYVLILAVSYAIYIVVLAAIHKRQGALYALIGEFAVFAIAAYNTLAYFDFAPRYVVFNFVAHIIFFSCQALVLSFRFAYSLKEARQNAEKASRTKTEFLSTLSHEMKTPLNAVLGMANYLIQDNPKKDQMESLHTLKSSAEHLKMLIENMFDFSKIDMGKSELAKEKVNLRELLASIHRALERKALEKGLDFRLEVNEIIPHHVLCDKNRLQHVISHLAENAIRFTFRGFVYIKVSVLEQRALEARLLFEVRDSGIGIDKIKRELRFESVSRANSFTKEYPSTGTRLALVRKMLLQGSDIEVVNSQGEGSSFLFSQWFTLVKEPQAAVPLYLPLQENEEATMEGKRILVVEDNKVNVLVIKKFLRKWGAEVEVADNGLIAVEKHAETAFDLILMDLQMPVMDGYQSTAKIREKDRKVPILAITAGIPSEVKGKILSSGMTDLISKPFAPEELKAKLIKSMGGQ